MLKIVTLVQIFRRKANKVILTARFPENKLLPSLCSSRGRAALTRREALDEGLARILLRGNPCLFLAPVLAIDLDVEPDVAVEDEDEEVADGNGVVGDEGFPTSLEEPAVSVAASHGNVPEPTAGASEDELGAKFSSQTLLKRCRNPL